MSLLADQLRTIPIDFLEPELKGRLQIALAVCPLFKIQNVADYIKQQRCTIGMNEGTLNVAPPFSMFWMEYRHLTEADIGLHFQALKLNDGWEMTVACFCRPLELRRAELNFVARLILDSQGHVTDQEVQPPLNGNADAAIKNAPAAGPGLLALAFLHCKNITTLEHRPPVKLEKRNRKRGKLPMLRYHTIEIEPLKTILRTEGKCEEVGLKRALHICRGHFAHYPETGPGLFGKGIYGDFWITQHARGSIEQGAVISDYNVKKPKPI